jgi:hypothetical protein
MCALCAAAVVASQACDQASPLETEVSAQARAAAEPCAFGQSFSLESTNVWFPLNVGSTWLLEGEEDDEEVALQIVVLDETEVVGVVTTRVVEETEWVDDEVVEISRNFVALTADATVCYFGEDVDIFEDGEISHEGAWRADEPGNFPGVLMPADPRPGMKFLMEGAPGIAADQGTVVGSGRVTVPAGSFDETIRVREVNTLDGGFDFKVYARVVGLLVDGPLSLVSY